jgi:FkbM family methyltransferase
MRYKEFIRDHFPFAGALYRFAAALKDTMLPEKSTYSQFKEEDVFALQLLEAYDLGKGRYVDIGCNHPTKISNTYKFYRKGYHGILFEPNAELARLNRIFRPRDVVFSSGCSNESAIVPFYISREHVLSSCRKESVKDIIGVNYINVFRLDDALKHLDRDFIYFMSVDVEGLSMEVLEGAADTIGKVLVLCIEFDDNREAIVNSMNDKGFDLVKTTRCNLIFRNRDLQRFAAFAKSPNVQAAGSHQ